MALPTITPPEWAQELLDKVPDVTKQFSEFTQNFNPGDIFGGLEGLTTVDLVEPLFESTTTYIYQMLVGGFVKIIDLIMQSFQPTSNFAYELFGVSGGYNSASFNVFNYVAAFALIGLFVFSLFTIGFGGITEQKNEIHELIFRFFAAIVMIINIRPFLQILNDSADIIISLCSSTIAGGFGSEASASGFIKEYMAEVLNQVLFGVFMIILIIAMLIEFVKLVMEIIERYLVVFLLHIASPIAASLYVSRTTSSILSNFMRMYLSQLFLLIMNKFFMYLFGMAIINNAASTLVGCMAVITFLKCAQRIDSYMKSLGLTVAQTGDALFGSIGMAVASMGKLIRGGRNTANTVGKALEVAGASKGDLGMATLGTALRSGIASKDAVKAQAFKTFSENGGLARTASGDAKANRTFMDLMNNGNYKAASTAPSGIQTSAIKAAFTQGGTDAFYQATGFHAADIKSAQVMSDGSIKGIVQRPNASGGVNRYGFTASPNSLNGKNSASTTLFESGQMYTSITPSQANNCAGMEYTNLDFASYGDNLSPVAAETGANINNQQWADLGITSAEVTDDNILVGSNSSGESVAAINLETGASYDYGSTSNRNDPVTCYSEENILNNSEIKSMLPKGAVVTPGSYNEVSTNSSNYEVHFDWTSKTAAGQMTIERPVPSDLSKDSKATLAYKGPAEGSFKFTNSKKTQSQTNAPK